MTKKLATLIGKIARFALYPLAVVLVVSATYHLYFANKIIPGVVLGGVKVGGLTLDQAVSKTKQQELATKKEFTLWDQNGKNYSINLAEIDLAYDWDLGVRRAFEVGRTGNFITDTKDKLAGFVKILSVPAKYTYNKDLLGGQIAQIRSAINIPSISAGISLAKEGKLEITPEVYGKSLDEKALYDTIRICLDNMDRTDKTLAVEDDNPQYTKKDLEGIINQAQNIISRPIELSYQTNRYVLQAEDLVNLIRIGSSNGKAEINIDKTAFENLHTKIASDLNKLPLGQVVKEQDGRVLEFKIIQNGLEIDRGKMYTRFKQAFFGTEKSFAIPVKEIQSSKNGTEYGIFTLLGRGISKFTGSAQGRITNLALAAQRTNGVLVAPGKEYSFNQAIGEISGKTGYATAYIIAQGRTVLGEGGGVCQTSTTLFRAVLAAGLPITSRHPHAYRVGYYELESPVGFDASVYQPSLDFKFVNDTSGYILIQAATDTTTNTLTFDIYGTPDGRKVEISEPKLYNVYAPPAALYQDDPTLPKGVVKQIDFSAPGGTAEFTRKVTRGDELLFEDTYKSVYRPWRAIFLVGTKTN
ncbi:MAG: hypothetical protein UW82_C0003G0003 [candidate division WWE3 bacterium GW2011_GWC2_44_9]|uniref:YoaR-like putative peptidoglycan binding domain-containing protein n=1 Tax=candidate division WWE3 bacterium GW2011_GWC2_44_9 TaxID=1619125 RepID=A0A0G1KNQ1_UNCKA|nr:MAG: hypothetical protein UW82_C0003G0003 [candidate division WWE3 bacterium GW2011_GWC2_44_9]